MKLTDAEIVEGLKLADKATPGPWEAQIPAMTGEFPRARVRPLKIEGRLYSSPMIKTDDAEFIAASRTLLPKALKELQELREVCSNQTGEILNLQNELKDIKSEIWVGNVMHWKSRAERAEASLRVATEQRMRLANKVEKAEARLEKAVKALENQLAYLLRSKMDPPQRKLFASKINETLKEIRGSE